jgi:Permuted papain-like amidase enzyme, YaeF/YiiX, C92 family
MNSPMRWLGAALARYLSKPLAHYHPIATVSYDHLLATIRPGDVLLVDGNTRVSVAIKYLTQSTWSHAALYIGDALGGADKDSLIEADTTHGVIAVPLVKYSDFQTRICRPEGLTPEDLKRVIDYARMRIGNSYDLKNVFDLARYLIPKPPVPTQWRRRMIGFGSGEPTKAICSTLIAQAFESVHFPILPNIERINRHDVCENCYDEILHVRHFSLFTPRDFDVSPYFSVVKPSLSQGFNYRQALWAEVKAAV